MAKQKYGNEDIHADLKIVEFKAVISSSIKLSVSPVTLFLTNIHYVNQSKKFTAVAKCF